MKVLFILVLLAGSVGAQTFTATATITIQRKADTQAKADKALREDIGRFISAYATGLFQPTTKDLVTGVCNPFTASVDGKVIDLDIVNRNPATCAILTVGTGNNTRPDYKSAKALENAIQRLVRGLFNGVSDAQYGQELRAAADAQFAVDKGAREAEKP